MLTQKLCLLAAAMLAALLLASGVFGAVQYSKVLALERQNGALINGIEFQN
jgi:hypothetical protein